MLFLQQFALAAAAFFGLYGVFGLIHKAGVAYIDARLARNAHTHRDWWEWRTSMHGKGMR